MTNSASTTRLLAMACITFAMAARAAEIPNPAAVFCKEQGGAYRVVQETEGERGICVLQDGRQVDARGYFREHHASPSVGTRPTAESTHTDGGSMTGNKRVGGWTRQDTASEDAQAALDWVLGQMNTAAGLRGIRGVWTQVVAGLNYAIEFELDNGEVWHTVVFRDLDGKFHLAQPAQLGPRPDPYNRKD
jgi:putative hemolysin